MLQEREDEIDREISRSIAKLTPEQLAILRSWVQENPDLREAVEKAVRDGEKG